MKFWTHEGIPCRIVKRTGDRVLVQVVGWPFPRWVDASAIAESKPGPFVPALF